MVLEAATPDSIALLLTRQGDTAGRKALVTKTNNSTPEIVNGTGAKGEASTNAQRQLFVFSAKSDSSLGAYLASFAKYLEGQDDHGDFLKNLSFTLSQHRNHFTHRQAIASGSLEELKAKLSSTTSVSGKASRTWDPTVGFIFTGQGAQYAQMVKDLHHIRPFSDALTRADGIIRKFGASWSLIGTLTKPPYIFMDDGLMIPVAQMSLRSLKTIHVYTMFRLPNLLARPCSLLW